MDFSNSFWTSERLYYNDKNYFSDLCEAIRKAQKLIYLEYYNFAEGKVISELLAELKLAAQRGVRILIVADGFGSFDWHPRLDLERQKNISVRIYHPFIGPRRWFSQHLSHRWARLLSVFSRVNRRTHKKLCVIDTQIAFVGSFNIMDANWHETGVRLEGEPVVEIEKSFYWTWHRSILLHSKKQLWRWPVRTPGVSWHPLVRVNHARRWRRRLYQDFLKRLQGAQEKIYLVTPYFNPPRNLIRRLELLSRRNVKVKLLLPQKSDVAVFSVINHIYLYRLIQSGAEIFLYRPKILHSKITIIDGWSAIGSTNLNSRSFFHDQELDVVLTNPQVIHELNQNIEKDFQASQKLKLDEVKHSFLIKISLFFLKPFLRWM